MSTTLRLSLFWSLALCILMVAYVVSDTVAPVYPVEKERMRLIEQYGHEIEAIAVGNSHNRAIDFESLGLVGLHLWRPGGDVFEAAHTVESLVVELPQLRLVFLPISFSSFDVDNSVLPERVARRVANYGASWSTTPLPGDWRLFVSGKLEPLTRPDRGKNLFVELARKSDPVVEADGWERKVEMNTVMAEPALVVHGRRRANEHARFGARTLEENPKVPDHVEGRLSELAVLLGQYDVRLVLVIPPYHAGYLGFQDAFALRNTRGRLRALATAHWNVEYVDANAADLWSDDASFFADSNHLNSLGAQSFSTYLRCSLRIDSETRGSSGRLE